MKIYEEHCKDLESTLDLSGKVEELRKISERGILLHGWMGIITDERPSNPTKRDGSSLTWIDSKSEKKIRSPPKTIKKTLEEDTTDYNLVSVDDEAAALSTPCFAACPSGGALRAEHRQCPDVADTSLFLEQLTDEQRELVLDKIT